MLANQGQASTVVSLQAPTEAADTVGATGPGVAVSGYDGDLTVIQNVGVVTAGSITGKLQEADDSSGTNAADISGATFTAATAPGIQKITVPRKSLSKPYLRYVGTIVTGPALVSVTLVATKKYTT